MNGQNPLLPTPTDPAPVRKPNPLLIGTNAPNPLLDPTPAESPPGVLDIAGKIAYAVTVGAVKEMSRNISDFLVGTFYKLPMDYASAMSGYSMRPVGNPTEEIARIQSARRGAALIASLPAEAVISDIPIADPLRLSSLIGEWGSYATAAALGGGVYGAVRPTEDGESRASAILGDAAMFGAIGLAGKAVADYAVSPAADAYKRYILALPRAKRIAALRVVNEGLDQLNSALGKGGVNIEQLPPSAGMKLEMPVLEQAIRKVEGDIDLDDVVKKHSDAQLETTPRFAPEQPKLDLPPGPVEPPTWKKFNEALEKERQAAPAKPTEPTETPRPTLVRVALRDPNTGRVHVGNPDETTHPQMMARLANEGTPVSTWLSKDEKYDVDNVTGFITSDGKWITKEDALLQGLRRPPLRPGQEQLVGPTVRGHSGKLYVGGATHPETIEQAVKSGVPEAEFAGVTADSPNRGFKTNLRDFVSREEAARITGQSEPLFSETMHEQKLAADATPEGVDTRVSQTVDESNGAKLTPAVALNAGVDKAVAKIEPKKISSPLILHAKELLEQAYREHAKLPTRTLKQAERVAKILTDAMRKETPASEAQVTLELTNPGPRELQLTEALPPYARKAFRRELKQASSALAKSLERENPPISVSQSERLRAEWERPPVPVNPKDLTSAEIGAHLKPSDLDEFRKKLFDLARERGGFATTRLLFLGTGSAMEALSFDDNLDSWQKEPLRVLGAALIIGGITGSAISEWAKTVTRPMLLRYSPGMVMSATDKEPFYNYLRSFSGIKVDAEQLRRSIARVFPDQQSQHALMYVADEGPSAPEWHLLSPAQQNSALVLHQMELARGILLKNKGVLDNYINDYVRHLLPPGSFERWKTHGWKTLSTGGAFTKPRRIMSLRDLEAWAAKEGIAGPIMDPSKVYALHDFETNRALATVGLIDELKTKGVIVPHTGSIPNRWRPLTIAGLTDHIAPDAVASQLDIIATRGQGDEVLGALGDIKNIWMRAIMMLPWTHGLNGMRAVVAAIGSPHMFGEAWKAVDRMDPGFMEAAKVGGVNFWARPDFGLKAYDAWTNLLTRIHLPGAGTLGANLDRIQERSERFLWDKLMPTFQYMIYHTKMMDWAERTGGKFGPESAEYKAMAVRAGEFANRSLGLVPDELQHAGLNRMLRFALFSPKWTLTRIGLMAHAGGDLGEMAAGRLSFNDAWYLHLKMRQLAVGMTTTWILSRLLSHEDPTYNENTSKVYARTGVYNSQGREIGVDVLGWWQDDLKLFNHPWDYISGRLNPMLTIAHEVVTSRDWLGREVTTGEKIGDVAQSLGPYAGIPSAVATMATGRTAPSDIIGDVGRNLTLYNTSQLPTPMDAALGKIARKTLIDQGLPATGDNIHHLAGIMRNNLVNSRDLIDGSVVSFLSYMKRQETLRHPISSAIGQGPGSGDVQDMWQEARRVLADF